MGGGGAIIGLSSGMSVINDSVVNTIPETEGQNVIEVPALDLKKSGAQGGSIRAIGHAYIGLNDPVPGSDTQVDAEDNDFTSVVLLEDNIDKSLVDGVTTGKEEFNA